MASSIRLGVRTLGFVAKDAEGVLLMTCDQPAVTAQHLSRVMMKQEVKASRYAERNGVPAYFPKKYFKDLMALTGDAGAKELLSQARARGPGAWRARYRHAGGPCAGARVVRLT